MVNPPPPLHNAMVADVRELPNAYCFIVDVPGIRRDQITMGVRPPSGPMHPIYRQRMVLAISVERQREEGTYKRRGRGMGRRSCELPLPRNANTNAILVNCEDGVLTLTVQKSPPVPQNPRNIEFTAG